MWPAVGQHSYTLHTIASYRMWLQSLQNDRIANIATYTYSLKRGERGHLNSRAFNIQTQPSNGAATGRNGSCANVSTAVTRLVTFPVSCNLFPSQVHFNFRAQNVIIFFAINCWRHGAWQAAILQNQTLVQNSDLMYMPLHRTSSNFLPDEY